jgi:SAM-dependent methyltransferase
MTAVSDLVYYKNQLDLISVSPIEDQAALSLNEFLHVIETQAPHDITRINNRYDDIVKSFAAFDREISSIRAKLKEDIEASEKILFQQSYSSYQDESIYDAFHILGRRWQPNSNLNLFYARIRKTVDWRYPAMIFRPGYENFIDELVGYDPVYLVDVAHKFIEPAMNKFNIHYQRRLREYIIKENPNVPILNRLPDNQFGIVVGCHFFNFRPLEVVKQYMSEIYTKLRPGGVFMMTFNDCDRWPAVKLVEDKKDGSYTPGALIFDLAKSMGYIIDYSWHDKGPQTWLELRKPGLLSSIKGGQPLAKIVSK